MNVLVLGNGLDIFLGMSTRYTDFMDFTDEFKKVFEKSSLKETVLRLISQKHLQLEMKNYEVNNEGQLDDKYVKFKTNIFNIYDEKINVHNIKYFFTFCCYAYCLKENQWIDYFLLRKCGDKYQWNDFEKEINDVLRKLSRLSWSGDQLKLYDVIKKFDSGCFDINIDSQLLYEDFKKLISAMEIYLDMFVLDGRNATELVNDEKIRYVKDELIGEKINKILCFNYINNYKDKNDFYDTKVTETDEVCFVHGQLNFNRYAEKKSEKIFETIDKRYDMQEASLLRKIFHSGLYKNYESNLVLGIESTDGIEMSIFSNFFKDDQITKIGCDESYEDWARNDDAEYYLYVFGHSLGATDTEELSKLLVRKPNKITIFYYDDNARNDLEKRISSLETSLKIAIKDVVEYKMIDYKE